MSPSEREESVYMLLCTESCCLHFNNLNLYSVRRFCFEPLVLEKPDLHFRKMNVALIFEQFTKEQHIHISPGVSLNMHVFFRGWVAHDCHFSLQKAVVGLWFPGQLRVVVSETNKQKLASAFLTGTHSGLQIQCLEEPWQWVLFKPSTREAEIEKPCLKNQPPPPKESSVSHLAPYFFSSHFCMSGLERLSAVL